MAKEENKGPGRDCPLLLWARMLFAAGAMGMQFGPNDLGVLAWMLLCEVERRKGREPNDRQGS